jgi:hypothetical protein
MKCHSSFRTFFETRHLLKDRSYCGLLLLVREVLLGLGRRSRSYKALLGHGMYDLGQRLVLLNV